MRGQKPPSPPENPSNLGICVLASTKAMPHLNPMSTVSETKLTTEPPLTIQESTPITPASSAAPAASAAKRSGSPPAIAPIDVPTSSEMADVAVMAVCLELHSVQKTRPPNRQAYRPASGLRPASDASAIADGSMYAASVTPAMRSGRSAFRSVSRSPE